MAISVEAYSTSGNTVLFTGAGVRFWGFSARNTTANPATITVYDNTAASGTPVYSETFAANSDNFVQLPWAVVSTVGLTLAITGTTPNVVGSAWLE